MRRQRFDFEVAQATQSAAQRAAQAEREAQITADFVEEVGRRDPSLVPLARMDPKAAIERAFQKPEWRTWFNEQGRKTQGFVTPGQAPTVVGGAERNVQMVNTGNAILPVDPLEQRGPIPVGMSPAERDASARGWAGNAIARERLAMDREQAAATRDATASGRAPAGYRFTPDGNLEAIPGGPADLSRKDPNKVMRIEGAMQRADQVMNRIGIAQNRANQRGTTGLPGAVIGKVPGTDAYDLRADVGTIKANIGFAELQAMREASPTGGALGQVAVQELNALQSVIADLDPNQSPAVVRQNLRMAREHYANWRRTLEQQIGQTGGASGSWNQSDPLQMRGGGNDPLGIRR